MKTLSRLIQESKIIQAKDLKKGMNVLVYGDKYKIIEIDTEDGKNFTIYFDSGEIIELNKNDKVEVV